MRISYDLPFVHISNILLISYTGFNKLRELNVVCIFSQCLNMVLEF